MKITLKIPGELLDSVRDHLHRPHAVAYERVGFLMAKATSVPSGLLLLVEEFHRVEEDDYEWSDRVGAQIGSNAMRKAVQAAYRPQRSLLHIHTHRGRGKPGFSSVDLQSASKFVPGFFSPIPKMPHGLIVLSDDDAAGLLWAAPNDRPHKVGTFIRVGPTISKKWNSNEKK